MKSLYSSLCAEIVLKGYAFEIFDAAQEFVEIDVAILEIANLCANSVIGYGTVDDIIIMNRFVGEVFPVVINKSGPLF